MRPVSGYVSRNSSRQKSTRQNQLQISGPLALLCVECGVHAILPIRGGTSIVDSTLTLLYFHSTLTPLYFHSARRCVRRCGSPSSTPRKMQRSLCAPLTLRPAINAPPTDRATLPTTMHSLSITIEVDYHRPQDVGVSGSLRVLTA